MQQQSKNNMCPVSTTLSIVGGKWKPVILWTIRNSPTQFGGIKRRIPPITHKVLTEQLRELERDGIVSRKVYPVVPPRVEYSLTVYGRTLLPVIEAMETWGKEHKDKVAGGDLISIRDIAPIEEQVN